MPRTPCRKFTLADVMILVGFTATGLALGRSVFWKLIDESGWYAYPMSYGEPLFVCWTVAFLTLRLRKPRPAIRHLFRQPGASASLVSLPLIVVWSVILGLEVMPSHWRNILIDGFDGVVFSTSSIGAAVLGAWFLLWVTRMGRIEPGWIDRSGIAIGSGWIVLMLVVLCYMFIS